MSKSGGFLSSITSGVNTFVNDVGQGFHRAVEEVDKAWSDARINRFHRAFQVPPQEVLYGEFWAQCLNGTSVNTCTIYVSSNFISFIVNVPNQSASVMIPFKDVVNIQRAITLRTQSGIPSIQTTTDPNIKADAIQIFTSDMKLHQFFSFMSYEKSFSATALAWSNFKQAQQQPPAYQAQQGYPVPLQTQPPPYVSAYPNVNAQPQGNAGSQPVQFSKNV